MHTPAHRVLVPCQSSTDLLKDAHHGLLCTIALHTVWQALADSVTLLFDVSRRNRDTRTPQVLKTSSVRTPSADSPGKSMPGTSELLVVARWLLICQLIESIVGRLAADGESYSWSR